VALSCVEALERDLARMPDHLATGTLAATAWAMAYAIDHETRSATAKSNCARVLADVMGELAKLAPAEETHDAVDEIAQRRRRA
jgi:hypothetical protein